MTELGGWLSYRCNKPNSATFCQLGRQFWRRLFLLVIIKRNITPKNKRVSGQIINLPWNIDGCVLFQVYADQIHVFLIIYMGLLKYADDLADKPRNLPQMGKETPPKAYSSGKRWRIFGLSHRFNPTPCKVKPGIYVEKGRGAGPIIHRV
ncbi:hypothetical protein H5410_061199 [Solanum commersonii]|uniref:Uncharacterized protein n=1 Tax=Solanum commersonii TaxID=4109 RepID=A0A9J5W7G7_SOLCO|nr:hypothetical protein H5410_061199 [Solanum commersonii]